MRCAPSLLGPCFLPLSMFAPLGGTPQVSAGDYQGIPAGFDFPASNTDLERFRSEEKIEDMRKHVWNLWAGINQDAVGGGPIWETWFESGDTFSTLPEPEGLGPRQRRFKAPRQAQVAGAQPEASGDSDLSFVLFNKETHDHIRANQLYLKSKLDAIRSGFPAGTEFSKRKIPDFPRQSVSLKVIWRLVRRSGFTALPVWDERAPREHAAPIPQQSWGHFVAVDPIRAEIPEGETTTIPVTGVGPTLARVVSLKKFHHYKLETPQQVEAAQTVLGAGSASVGDYVALVGMHVTTKEIDDWVWATFWWHDRPDAGDYARHRTAKVPGVFRNYLMDAAFDMTTPKEDDGKPNAVMNPWLEASSFINGAVSNCMTCHQRALWPAPPSVLPEFRPWLPVTRDPMKPEDPLRADRMNVDFLWSIVLESFPQE